MSEENVAVENTEVPAENHAVEDFEKQFPDIENASGDVNSTEEANLNANAASEGNDGYAEPSVAISQWKERRELEISDRDRREEQEKVELQEDAVKHIDEFYDEYSRKKQSNLDAVKAEAEKFLKQREEFASQENTTTWDRALQLINQDDADIVNGRDRSKFKEILQMLKGQANAPGA